MEDETKTLVKNLSAGMAQKAMLAATLLSRPRLLILDEPFFRLDPVNRRLILGLIQRASDEGSTVILSTHQMDEAQRLCDRVLLLNEGVAVAEGTVMEVRESGGVTMGTLSFSGRLPKEIPGTKGLRVEGSEAAFELDGPPEAVLRFLLDAGVGIQRFEAAPPDLDETFVRLVEG